MSQPFKWVVCSLCGIPERIAELDELSRTRASGWRQPVVPIPWVKSLEPICLGSDDARTAKLDVCPACCIHLRAAFLLVQRIRTRAAASVLAARPLALAPAPGEAPNALPPPDVADVASDGGPTRRISMTSTASGERTRR